MCAAGGCRTTCDGRLTGASARETLNFMGQHKGRNAGLFALGLCLSGVGVPASGHAQTVILYQNDFESPNVPLAVDCGNSLDGRGINLLYGTADFQFAQQETVEAVFLDDIADLYKNAGDHGKYALGMLSTVRDDKLALAFDSRGYPFINIGIDLSSIDVQGCGGPFGVTAPRLRISLIDRPGGVLVYDGTVLDSTEVVGMMAPDAWTFRWKKAVVSLSTAGTTDGTVTVVFDLLEGGYSVFDNLSITASRTANVVDRDLDGVPDDEDNCPTTANPDQQDTDRDDAGDACDPAAADKDECGDRDRDGFDDCSGDAVALPDAGIDPAPPPPPPLRDGGVDAGPDSGTGGQAGAYSNNGGSDAPRPSPASEASGCSAMPGARGMGAGFSLVALGLTMLLRRRRKL
jgi:Thrombospondin type 3 repeat